MSSGLAQQNDGSSEYDTTLPTVNIAGRPVEINEREAPSQPLENGVFVGQSENESYEPPAVFVEESDGGQLYAEALERELDERHVNMIAFSTIIGVGLYLQAGKVVNIAGPGLAVVSYILVGSALWAVVGALGEMTALFPHVKGAIFEFPCRFLGSAVGYSAGWLSWFAWVVILAAEITAVAQLFDFMFRPEYLQEVGYPDETLQWTLTLPSRVDPAIFIGFFLLFVLGINMFRVRTYGWIEYCFGVVKMFFLVGLILFNMINNARKSTGFRYYDSPWGFQSKNHTSVDGEHVYTGGPAHLGNAVSAMVIVAFSLIGFETVSITAPENKALSETETVKMATRKIAIRILLLYILNVFFVGLNVPYDDANLQDFAINALRSGEHSIFIIAAVRDHVRGFPHFFNAFFIFCATSAGINALYLSSRLLHALATSPNAWPHYHLAHSCRRWLAKTSRGSDKKGAPRRAAIISWLFGLLGFLAVRPYPAKILGRMATNATASMLIVYVIICGAYIRFYNCLKAEAGTHQSVERRRRGNRDDYEDYKTAYSRKSSQYPYRARGGRGRALYGGFACFLLSIFNGWRTFSPFAAGDFVASYISLFMFLTMFALFQIREQGKNPLKWKRSKVTENLDDPLMTKETDRALRKGKWRGRSKDKFLSRGNWQALKLFLRDWIE